MMKIIDVSVSRPVTVWMFTFAVILFGMVSLNRLSVDLLPELSYPTLTIRTDYVGAAPAEVEQLVTKPIEEAVGIVKGIRNIHSVSKASQSDVVLEFDWGTEMDLASLDVREKLDVIQLPLDIKKPLLLRFNPNLDPILRLALKQKSEQVEYNIDELKQLRDYADEELKRKLEAIAGIASVKLGGGLEKEIQIDINQQKLSQLGLSSSLIVSRLQQENVNQSGGRVKDGSQEYLVRTINKFTSLDDMRNIYITTVNGAHIRLSDVATVTDLFKERDSVTRVDGIEAVEIALYREGDANTVQVANKVKQELVRITKELPESYQLIEVYDQSVFISSAISEVKNAAIVGGLLAMLVLFLFLKNVWATLIISISIPVSVIATFNLMYGNNISLNIMSLGGIALAVGLLVDNAIVVLENIARHKELSPENNNAASIGTKEVSSAIFASTLTTMAVFVPLVFVEGIAGQLFKDQALTVTFALLASLIVALTLIPMLAHVRANKTEALSTKTKDEIAEPNAPVQRSKIANLFYYLTLPFSFTLRVLTYYLPLAVSIVVVFVFKYLALVGKLITKPILWLFDKCYNLVLIAYEKALSQALTFRVFVLVGIITLSAGAVPLFNQLKVALIPPLAQGEFYVEIHLAPGTALQKTDSVLDQLANIANKNSHVKRTFSLAGTGSLMNASPAQGGDYWGKLNVILQSNTSKADEQKVMDELRAFIAKQPGVQANIARPELFSFKTPVTIELSTYDLEQLKRYSDKLVNLLEQDSMFVDVKSTLQMGHPEIKVQFDHARLAQLGLAAPDIAQLLAAKVGGTVASQYTINDKKIDILVRVDEQSRNSIEDVGQLIINPQSNLPIQLSSVAVISTSVGPSEITRIGQERVAVITANLGYGDIHEAALTAKNLVKQLAMPATMSFNITGQNEEMEVSFTSLKFALALAVFLVYLVMASQFESLLHPLLILFTVPLAAAGSVYGLYLTNTPLSIIVFIGLIMLAGIVVNNAIVLVDRINQLRAEGIDKLQAIQQAAITRLRPILMTTLTTTLGLLPLAIATGDGAEIRAPMAISVIYGLLYATLLTLFLIPVLYSVFDNKTFVVNGGNNE